MNEVVGFQAVIGGLSGYLQGVDNMVAANARNAQAQIAVANAAVKQNDALVVQAQRAVTAAKGTEGEALALANLTRAQEAANVSRATSVSLVEKSNSSTDGLVTKLKSAAVAAAQLAAVYGGFRVLDAAIQQTTDFGDATYRLQLVTGQTAESASSLLYGAEKLGVGFDALSASVRVFERNMVTVQEANDGFTGDAKTTQEILQGMGIAALDTSGKLKPFDTLLGEVANKMQALKDPVLETGLATQLFGRNGAALIPILQLGSAGIADFQKQAEALGHELSQNDVDSIHDYIISQRELTASIHGIEIEVGKALMGPLKDFADWFQKNQPAIREFIATFITDIEKLVKSVGEGFGVIEQALSWIPGHQAEVVAAVVAIGAAFAWAMPGGPVALGILYIIGLIGQIKDPSSWLAQATTTLANQVDSALGLSHENENKQFGALGGATVGSSNPAQTASDAAAKQAADAAAAANNAYAESLAKIPPAITEASLALLNLGDTLAGVALKAVQSAASALFAQATQEQAAMNLQLAQLNLQQLLSSSSDATSGGPTPTTISDYGGGSGPGPGNAPTTNPNADSPGGSPGASSAMSAPIVSAVNQAAQGIQDLLRQQIAATQQSASDLDTAFKASNEAFQMQINAAIGKGDTAGALGLVQQQKTAATTYQAQAKALQTTEQNATKQLTMAQLQTNQNTAIATNTAAVTASTKASTAQTSGVAANTKAVATHTTTTVASKTALEKQIDAVTKSIAIENARKEVMKDTLVVADKSLLTDKEQEARYQELLPMIGAASKAYRDAAAATGYDLITPMDDAKRALTDMTKYGIDTTKEKMIDLMNAAQKAASALNTITPPPAAAPTATGTVGATGASSTQVQTQGGTSIATATVGSSGAASTKVGTTTSNQLTAGSGGYYTGVQGTASWMWHSATPGNTFDEGGIVTAPTFGANLAVNSQPEAIIPLSNISRAREIMAAIPASILSAISPRSGGGPGSVFGDLNVTGNTLEDMEAAAYRAIATAFSRAKQSSGRSGSNVPIPLGAGMT